MAIIQISPKKVFGIFEKIPFNLSLWVFDVHNERWWQPSIQ